MGLSYSMEPGDRVDLLVADPAPLLAEALAHLHPLRAGIDELDLALTRRLLAVRQHPDVGRYAGVVEELLRQRDDCLEPVVLDDPAADVRLARGGASGEQRRAVVDDRDPRAAMRGIAHL